MARRTERSNEIHARGWLAIIAFVLALLGAVSTIVLEQIVARHDATQGYSSNNPVVMRLGSTGSLTTAGAGDSTYDIWVDDQYASDPAYLSQMVCNGSGIPLTQFAEPALTQDGRAFIGTVQVPGGSVGAIVCNGPQPAITLQAVPVPESFQLIEGNPPVDAAAITEGYTQSLAAETTMRLSNYSDATFTVMARGVAASDTALLDQIVCTAPEGGATFAPGDRAQSDGGVAALVMNVTQSTTFDISCVIPPIDPPLVFAAFNADTVAGDPLGVGTPIRFMAEYPWLVFGTAALLCLLAIVIITLARRISGPSR